jgi:hypothetical protein
LVCTGFDLNFVDYSGILSIVGEFGLMD